GFHEKSASYNYRCLYRNAKVAELADAPDLGSGGETRGGSSPPFRTNLKDFDSYIGRFHPRRARPCYLCGPAGWVSLSFLMMSSLGFPPLQAGWPKPLLLTPF